MHANQREELEEVQAGDIVALVGMKNVGTGGKAGSRQPGGRCRVAFRESTS